VTKSDFKMYFDDQFGTITDVVVKRAVPKELSPAPTRPHLSGYNYDTGFRLVSATSSSII
ncbi:hypothetical protein L195_g058572, partial [Trifolium pratense]